jgi:hypothetical protein
MVHIAWDNGQRTSISLKRLKKDENEGRLDGALPIAFELSRSFDLAQRFGGPRVFVEDVDSAVWTFYDSIARHLRDWQARPSRRELNESETSQEADQPPEKVVIREASVPGGKAKVFDDGSIEIQTASGTKWFRSFTELERSLRGKDGVEPRQNATSESNNGGGHGGAVKAPAEPGGVSPSDTPAVEGAP